MGFSGKGKGERDGFGGLRKGRSWGLREEQRRRVCGEEKGHFFCGCVAAFGFGFSTPSLRVSSLFLFLLWFSNAKNQNFLIKNLRFFLYNTSFNHSCSMDTYLSMQINFFIKQIKILIQNASKL